MHRRGSQLKRIIQCPKGVPFSPLNLVLFNVIVLTYCSPLWIELNTPFKENLDILPEGINRVTKPRFLLEDQSVYKRRRMRKSSQKLLAMADEEDIVRMPTEMTIPDASLSLLSRANVPLSRLSRSTSSYMAREAALRRLLDKCTDNYLIVNKVLRLIITSFFPDYSELLTSGSEDIDEIGLSAEIIEAQTRTMELLKILIIAIRAATDEQDQLIWNLENLSKEKGETEDLEPETRLDGLEKAVERLAEVISRESFVVQSAGQSTGAYMESVNPLFNPTQSPGVSTAEEEEFEEEEEWRGR